MSTSLSPDWFVVNDVHLLDSPALLIYTQRVKNNIAHAIRMVGDPSRLRPHVKTHKSAEVTSLMREAGITKFKCATIAEAEMLAQCGAASVLLAYQPVGPKIERFLKLVQQYPSTNFSCLADASEAASALGEKANELGVSVDVFLDINIGMNRTGVLPENALALLQACKPFSSIRVAGLHGYDGHINDTTPGLRKQKADEAFSQLQAVNDQFKLAGMNPVPIVVGGSPTFGIHAKREGVECSPGTFVYWDRSYEELFPDLPFEPAAVLLTRVVSVPTDKTICVDLGHKSVAAENVLQRRVHFLNAEGIEPVSQSEEHLVLQTPLPHQYKPGDVLYGIPFHVCPTCALYGQSFVIEEGRVAGIWNTVARERKISV